MPKKDTREISTRKCDSYGNYEIYMVGGGQIPKELGGIFTGKTLADNKLADYNTKQGIVDEAKKLKEEIKSITPLDHEYDEV
jgi:hypothetical protein